MYIAIFMPFSQTWNDSEEESQFWILNFLNSNTFNILVFDNLQ